MDTTPWARWPRLCQRLKARSYRQSSPYTKDPQYGNPVVTYGYGAKHSATVGLLPPMELALAVKGPLIRP
jgi:hypothetical protein